VYFIIDLKRWIQNGFFRYDFYSRSLLDNDPTTAIITRISLIEVYISIISMINILVSHFFAIPSVLPEVNGGAQNKITSKYNLIRLASIPI